MCATRLALQARLGADYPVARSCRPGRLQRMRRPLAEDLDHRPPGGAKGDRRAKALSRGQTQRLSYHVFDLLHLDGRDLISLALIECKPDLLAVDREGHLTALAEAAPGIGKLHA